MDTKINNLQSFKRFFSGPKIIFTILGIILLVEFVYAVKVLTSPAPVAPTPPPASKNTVLLSGGKISLGVPKTSFAFNEVISVNVMVESGGHDLDGVDLIIRYDPKILEATSGGIIKGKIFDEYPLKSVDSKKGLIAISGISSLKSSFKGTGLFATMNLKAKAPGITALTVDFATGSTSDSNLVEAGSARDILEAVNNLELTVR